MFNPEKLLPYCFSALALLQPLIACSTGDLEGPSIEKIAIISGSEVISEIEPQWGVDTTLEERVPLDAKIRVVFSEPVDFESATKHIVLLRNDSTSERVDVVFHQELYSVGVSALDGALEPSTTYIFEINEGIRDTSGNTTDTDYKVNFHTMDAF